MQHPTSELPRTPPYHYVCRPGTYPGCDAQEGRGWLENTSPSVMAAEELPLGPSMEVSTAHRDRRSGEVAKSREPSAGSSEGKLLIGEENGGDDGQGLGGHRRWQRVSLGSRAGCFGEGTALPEGRK